MQGLKDPEAKRKAIGAGFIEVFNDFAKDFERKPRFLVQVCTLPSYVTHTMRLNAWVHVSHGAPRNGCLP